MKNDELNEKVVKYEEAVSIVRAYEDIIKTKKNIICVVYRQGLIFKRFKEKDNLVRIIKEFGISKSNMIFKINIVKLVDKYPKLKRLLLSMHSMKNYFRRIK